MTPTTPMSGFRRRAVLVSATAAIGALSLVLTGCADTGSAGASSSSSTKSSLPAALVAAGTKEAKAISGGKKIGGTVKVVGTLTGQEKSDFLAALQPFEDVTGITVDYTGTEAYTTLVQTGVDSGNPPDVINLGNLAMVQKYASEGKLVSIDKAVGKSTMSANFDSGLLDSTSYKGTNYGIWTQLDTYGIWYNAKTYSGPTTGSWADLTKWTTKEAAAGTTPWCIGLSSGATTGWPGAYMILNNLLKESGPGVVNALSDGTGTWDSPEVKAAFESFGDIATSSKMVAGGGAGALSADQATSGNGMFANPQKCSLMDWGEWSGSSLLSADSKLKAVKDVNYFSVPYGNKAYANDEGITGTFTSAFTDTPAVRAYLKYVASVPAQNLTAATGNWIAASKGVSATSYPNELFKSMAKNIIATKHLTTLPVTVIDPTVKSALYTAVANYVQDPSTLDTGLKAIDAAQAKLK